MSNGSPSLDDEMARWHRFSDGAIGSKFALMTLFLATTPPELREQLRETIIPETEKSTTHGLKTRESGVTQTHS